MLTAAERLARSYPRDLTPEQRNATRLAAVARLREKAPRVEARLSVVMPEPAPDRPEWPGPLARPDHVSWVIELLVRRATCVVHGEFFAILHLDEALRDAPCPLCWAAAAYVPGPR